MPIHDWTRVDAAIFHAFHHDWITDLSRALNRGILPDSYYALPEQFAGGFGPDVPTLQGAPEDDAGAEEQPGNPGAQRETGGLLVAQPKIAPTAVTDAEFYRRKQSKIVVRHVSGDRVVAMIEIVSPGNKSTRHAIRSFVEKAADLLGRGVHLLIVDLFPPGPRDRHGIHALLWDEVAGQAYAPSVGKPLTVASYESDVAVRTFVQPVAVGEALPDWPLFLRPNACVQAPLEATYQATFAAMPRRWRRVLESRAGEGRQKG
jgi:hypothetical protein